jgi:hypothetical protein
MRFARNRGVGSLQYYPFFSVRQITEKMQKLIIKVLTNIIMHDIIIYDGVTICSFILLKCIPKRREQDNMPETVTEAYNASFDVHSLFRTARAFQVPFPRLQVGCLMYAYSKLKGVRCEENAQYRRFALAKACDNEGIALPGMQQIDDTYDQTDFHRAAHDAQYLYTLLQCMLRIAVKGAADGNAI